MREPVCPCRGDAVFRAGAAMCWSRFSILSPCRCPLLRLVFHVRLSPVSCSVECWVTTVWCQMSWCLPQSHASTLVYEEFTCTNSQILKCRRTHACMWHAYWTCTHTCGHACTCCGLYHDSRLCATWSITPAAIRATGEAFLPNNWGKEGGMDISTVRNRAKLLFEEQQKKTLYSVCLF